MWARFTVLVLIPAACTGHNHTPIILPIGPLEVSVGDTLIVDLLAYDPDGDPVFFDVEGAPSDAKVESFDGASRFVYSPTAVKPGGELYQLIFTAKDGRGGESRLATTLKVMGAAPVFVGPFAWTLDLSVSDALVAIIGARDDDTAKLQFRLLSGPEGVSLIPIDGHSVALFFRPTLQQVVLSGLYGFRIGVSDGDHEQTVSDFVVLLNNRASYNRCRGGYPQAWLEPMRDHVSGEEVRFVLHASDEESTVSRVFLHWSLGSNEFKELEMKQDSEGVFEAVLKDIASTGIVYFYVEILDDDDPFGDVCDHFLRIPKKGEMAFSISDPSTCLEDWICGFDCNEASPAQLPNGHTSGLRLCQHRADVFSLSVKAGQWLAVEARSMANGEKIHVKVLDTSGKTLLDGEGGGAVRPDSDGYLKVIVGPSSHESETYELWTAVYDSGCSASNTELIEGINHKNLCPGEVDEYKLYLSDDQAARISLMCKDADLDLIIWDSSGHLVYGSATTFCADDIVIEGPDDYVVVVKGEGLDHGPYDLTVTVDKKSVLCRDDIFSPNATPSDAPIIREGVLDKLRLCPDRADFFAIGLNGGEVLTAKVQPDVIPISVMDSSGKTIGLGMGGSHVSTIETVAAAPGKYTIQVGPVPTAQPYSLFVGTQDSSCSPDRFEPNDDALHASNLPVGLTTHLTMCDGDLDVFGFRLGALEALRVVVLAGSTLPRAIATNVKKEVIASSVLTDLGEELIVVSKEDSTVFIEIKGVGKAGWYDLEIEHYR